MNEKITCIIVDDEPAALQQMQRYARQTPFLEVMGTYNNGMEVLAHLQNQPAPDLIFLDIQMPELNGMDLAKILPPGTRIIFTTAFDRYAIEGYKVNALDYLLKPIDYAEFLSAATRARDSIHASKNNAAASSPTEQVKNYIFVKSEYKQLKIKLADILYIEGLKDYVKIHLSTESYPVVSLNSLKRLEEELPAGQFMRVHRSFIVALDKIDQIERSQIIIKDQRITIADQYRAAFNDFIQKKSV